MLASGLAVLCAVYAIYVASAVPQVTAWITNSDQLTIPAFIVDVFAQPANVFGWQLPRASYLFPDAVAYALAFWTMRDPFDSILLAHVPVLLTWIYVVYRAAPHNSGGGERSSRLAWALAAGLLFPLVLTQLSTEMAAWVTKYVFSITNHFTCFALGTLLLWWTLDDLAGPRWSRLAAIGLVTTLLAASNRAVWLFYVLPLGVVLAAVLLRSPRGAWKSVGRIALVALAGVIVGYAIEGSFNRIEVMPYDLTPEWMSARARAFFATLVSYGSGHPAMAFGLALLATFYILVLWRVAADAPAFWRREMSTANERVWLFDAALLIATLANVLATMIAWENIGSARYLMLFFFAPPLLARRLLDRSLPARAYFGVALLLFAGSAVAAYRADGPLRLAKYAHNETAPLASCLRALQVGRGLANYWIARRVAFLSNGAIRLDQVSPGAGSKETLFFYWGNNAFAFLRGHPDVDAYQYVIADTLDHKVLTDAFGAPDAVTHCANREIWTWTDKTRVFAGLFQGHLEPWQRLLMKDWIVSIPAVAFRGATDSRNGLARTASPGSTAQGALIGGSRLALPAGTYRFAVAFTPASAGVPAGTKLGTLRLQRTGGQSALFADLFADGTGRAAEVSVVADVSGPDDILEPQVLYAEKAPLRVDMLTVTQVARSDTEIRMRAGDGHLHTMVGVERDGFIATTGKSGVLLYGPYLPLSAGNYRASLYFATERPRADNGRVDLVAELGRKVLAERSIQPSSIVASGSTYRLDLDFDLDRPVRDLELRVFVDEDASVKIGSYEILPRKPARAAGNPPSKSPP